MTTRWDHRVVEIKWRMLGKSLTERAQEELSRQGQQGWELVSVVQSAPTDTLRLFLKRPS
jgi:L-amino acid N-acyltransferase YncA